MQGLGVSVICCLGILSYGCGDDAGSTATCSDGVLNQDETSVDCGGSCGATCVPGDTCSGPSDCTTGDCASTCQPATTCDDSMLNGSETDVDCGGMFCNGCTGGKVCTLSDDCVSSECGDDGVCRFAYTIGGTVTGVDGAGMVLQNSGGDNLAITADGTFTFSTPVVEGGAFAITLLTGPGTPALDCTIDYGSGIAVADVVDAHVSCITKSDAISDAFALKEGVEVRFSTVGATVETNEVVCEAGQTVWFSFTAADAGEFTTYATGSDHDTEIAWTDSLTGDAAGNLGGCNDDSADSYDAVDDLQNFAIADQEFVQVGLNAIGHAGTGAIGVTKVVEASDRFAGAQSLERRSGAASAVIGLKFAGTETIESNEDTACGGVTLGSKSAWLNFVAPSSGTWMIESKSTNASDLAVYTGTAVDALTLVHCATARHRAVLVDAIAGDTYRIRISLGDESQPVVVRAERTATPSISYLVDADGDTTSTDVGNHSDLAVVEGEPAIAYFDALNRELRFSQRIGSTWTDVLVDADGDGTGGMVGHYPSLAVLPSGEPVVAYFDVNKQQLRFAERSGGTWSDVLVDADGGGTSDRVGFYPSLIVLANGNPAIAYYDASNKELRYAERQTGTWSDVLVDADGDGESSEVGLYPGLIELEDGLGISYIGATHSQLRFARRVADVWTDELVYEEEFTGGLYGAGVVLDSTGNPVLAASRAHQGNHMIGWWNGSSWDLERNLGDRHIAELDFGCSPPRLLNNAADMLYLVWSDCSFSKTMAVSVRDAAGRWKTRDLSSQQLAPSDAAFAGTTTASTTVQFGAALLPSGELAVSFQDGTAKSLWCTIGN